MFWRKIQPNSFTRQGSERLAGADGGTARVAAGLAWVYGQPRSDDQPDARPLGGRGRLRRCAGRVHEQSPVIRGSDVRSRLADGDHECRRPQRSARQLRTR